MVQKGRAVNTEHADDSNDTIYQGPVFTKDRWSFNLTIKNKCQLSVFTKERFNSKFWKAMLVIHIMLRLVYFTMIIMVRKNSTD